MQIKLVVVIRIEFKDALKEHQEWLDSHQDADKEVFEEHLKGLQGVWNPIITKVYKAYGGPSASTDDYDSDYKL